MSSSTIGALASEEIEQASLDPPRSEISRGTTVLALPTGAPWTDLNPKPDLRSTTGIRPTEASKVPVCYVRNTSTPVVRFALIPLKKSVIHCRQDVPVIH